MGTAFILAYPERSHMSVESRPVPRRSPGLLLALSLFGVITVLGLTWAKWWPYTLKLGGLITDRTWPGSSILKSAGTGAAAPSLRGGWDFTITYGESIWKALVAALLIAAAVDALVPRRRLVGLLSRRGRFGGTFIAGLVAVPCMMCTCCTAPLAGTLRRQGVPTSSVLAYWLGNPTLNPAVLAFLALVAPWQWFATRLVVGSVLVFGVTTLVGRLTDRGGAATAGAAAARTAEPVDAEADAGVQDAPRRFARTLFRLAVTLVPEYAVVVFALGTFRGWLFPFDANAVHWGILAAVLAAILGTLVVIPTAGEIPILQGLTSTGVGAGVVGTLLITLPAISLPSMAMVMRDLSWRVTAATAAAVGVAGVAAGAVLWTVT